MSAGTALPRLLLGVGEAQPARLGDHHRLHGALPDLRRAAPTQLIDEVDASGLRGHGGAAFPVARKLRAVASRRGRKVVLVNGAEGEPASKKDRVLLRELPHLVLDGAAVAARAVGARDAVIAVPQTDDRSIHSLERAIDERRRAGLRDEPRLSLAFTPKRYITGQETALVNFVNTGIATPTFGARPFERGVEQRPTLVQNAETLAHLALIARHGAAWFRELGTPDDPGSALVTVAGAVRAPGVYEIAHGMPLADVLDTAGAEQPIAAVLLGGYFGSWVDGAHAPRMLLARRELSSYRATLGAGVIAVLGPDGCGVAETARVAGYLAGQGAGQCGPCVNGLGAIADTLQRLAGGTAHRDARRDLDRWCGDLNGRGACAPPGGGGRVGPRPPRPLRALRRTSGAPHARSPDPAARRMSTRLRVNPIQCVAHGLCAELLPEHVRLDDWGYPIIDDELDPRMIDHARRAADACPTLALWLEARER